MDEMIKTMLGMFHLAPWCVTAIIIVWIVLKNGGSKFLESFGSSEYVKLSDCHSHVDGFREEVQKSLNDISETMNRRFKDVVDHINKVETIVIDIMKSHMK